MEANAFTPSMEDGRGHVGKKKKKTVLKEKGKRLDVLNIVIVKATQGSAAPH